MPYKLIMHSSAFRINFITRFVEEIHNYINDIRNSCKFLNIKMPQYSIKHIKYCDLAPEQYEMV